MRTVEENKKLCERYPYLIVRNVWTDKIVDSYDYSYIKGEELPDGWRKLFMQMCEDIRQPLIDANYLDKFRFSQIKSKYGSMRCYDFGAPQTVHDIIDKYEYLSQFICEECGRPAAYQTSGWIESYCVNCIGERLDGHCIISHIEFEPIMRIHSWVNGETYDKYIDCSDEWRRLYE